MDYKPPHAFPIEQPKHAIGSRAASHHESRYSSGSDEFLRHNGLESGPSQPMDVTSQAAMNAAAGHGHDDSGIGMRTPDEDFSMGKYEFERNESHPQMESSELMHQPSIA
jgi:regulatory factor X